MEKQALQQSLAKAYFLAARPKTWIASLSPVFIGTALGAQNGKIDLLIFSLTLLFSFLIQVGTNFANDYFDFVKGTDSILRKGPKRATQEGWISPRSMLLASFIIFASAFVIATPLMFLAGLWSVAVATLCIVLGVLYTGGPRPLGYLGLGEVLVLVFFGCIPVCGAYFLQTHSLNWLVFTASLAPGLLSCSILIANNLRDEISDRAADKRTLIVRWGNRFGSWEYTLSIVFASLIPWILVLFQGAKMGVVCASAILPLSIPAVQKTFRFRDPLELIPVLQTSALLLFLYTALFCAGALLW
ncbi:MAG: 1,4-dihydroxy-2-naphthoate polyprenyltransferase [Chlamydiota bacterium]